MRLLCWLSSLLALLVVSVLDAKNVLAVAKVEVTDDVITFDTADRLAAAPRGQASTAAKSAGSSVKPGETMVEITS